MGSKTQINICAWFFALFFAVSPCGAVAWNIPGHMLSGSIAYQILRQESASSVEKVTAVLERHPWYERQWKDQLEKAQSIDRVEYLFMLAPRWADDIRTKDRAEHRGPWHYINYPFAPTGQATRPPEPANILTALAENERMARNGADHERRAIALTWLLHLVGDVHQPLHTAQLFSTGYPDGDRGGNLTCVRPSDSGKPTDLHRFWDGVITSSNNVSQLRKRATALLSRQEFSRSQLAELGSTSYESWAKESFQVATTIAYRNGAVPGTPKGSAKDCRDVGGVKVLPNGYARTAGRIADRRITMAGYRLADLLRRM